MIYELRRYEAMPGKTAALDEVMVNLAMPLFKKLGMQVIGAWHPIAGDYTNVLMYILAYESLNERTEKWEAFFNHPDWVKGRAEIVEKEGGPLAFRELHYFLAPTSYSPLQ